MLGYWIVKSWYLLIFHSLFVFERKTTYKILLVKVLSNMPATASVIDVAAHNVPDASAVAVDSAVTDVGAIVGVPFDPAYVTGVERLDW
jgi:hypothetical protein